MKKKLSKIISAILLAIAIAVTQIPASDVVAQPATSDFQVEDHTLVKYTGTAEAVSIPDGIKVIGNEAFRGHDEIVKLTIGNEVETIGYNAFANCTSLRNVVIEEPVTTIDSAAFSNCTGLEEISIGAAVSKLGNCIFAGCNKLTKVTVSDDNPHLAYLDGVLYDDELKVLYQLLPAVEKQYLTIPNTVEEIKPYAFWGDTQLEEVILGSALSNIPEYAFSNCTNLTGITIPYFIHSIGAKAFEDCVNLGTVTLPESISSIDDTAFDGCYKVQFETVPGTYVAQFASQFEAREEAEQAEYDTVTDAQVIDSGDVQPNTATQESSPNSAATEETGTIQPTPTSTTMPQPQAITGTVTEQSLLGNSPIVSGKALVFIDNSAKVYSGNEKVVTSTNQIDIASDEYKENGTEVTLIQDLFSDENEKSVGFPKYTIVDDSVIAKQAYYNDAELAEYTIPGGITEIGDFAFARTKLQRITIPEGVTTIGYGAFYHCDSLSQISIPDSVTSIEPYAFEHTAYLDNWSNEVGQKYLIVGDGILLAYAGSDSVVNIPDTVKMIAPRVFVDHTGITAVNMPDSVEVIGEEAFAGCRNLTTLNGANGLITIKDRAFKDCALKEIRIPAGVTSIGLQAYALTESGSKVVVFEGEQLPVLTYEDSATRLSATDSRGYAFGNADTAVVANTITDLSGTILENGIYGLDGNICRDSGEEVAQASVLPAVGSGVLVKQNCTALPEEAVVQAVIAGDTNPYVLQLEDSSNAEEVINNAYASLYGGRTASGLVAFDMTLYDETGTIPIRTLGKQSITVTMPLPEGLGTDNLHVVCTDENGQLEDIPYELNQEAGSTYIQFTNNHFSPYGLYQYNSGISGEAVIQDGKAVIKSLSGNKDDSPNTGEAASIHPKWFLAAGILLLAIAAFFYKGKDTELITPKNKSE